MASRSAQLKQFLFRNLYRHPQVMETTERAAFVVRDLFEIYISTPRECPALQGPLRTSEARAVCDYIAGMTDRFAIREHERLTGRLLFP